MKEFLNEIINHHETTKIKIQEDVYFCIHENINIKIRIDGHEQAYWLYIDGLYVATKIIEKTELTLKGVLTLSEYAEMKRNEKKSNFTKFRSGGFMNGR